MADILDQYHNKFTSEFKKLEDRIKENDPDVKTDIIVLKKEIESITHLLPKYQQLTYSNKVQSLIDQLSSTSKPNRRLRLNRGILKPRSKPDNLQVEQQPNSEDLKVEFKSKENITETSLKEYKFVSEIIRINERSKTLNDVSNSIIILDTDIESTTMNNISNSVIFIQTTGPALFSKLSHCLIIVECHQLRVHDSESTKFITQIESNSVIIENSRNLKFNDTIKVTDFNHPIGPSPNYSTYNKVEIPNDLIPEILKNPDLSNLEKYLNFI